MALETAALAPERCPAIGWAWLMVAVPPSIPATAAVRHIDFIDLVMVISWFRLAPGFVQPRQPLKGRCVTGLKGYSASTNRLIIVDV
jgi:hypothetical protein